MGGKLGPRLAQPEDFWAHVQKGGPDECWPWTAGVTEKGYGHVRYQKRNWKASRLAYVLTNGPISPKVQVRHRCDNPPCCNPAHLLAGTHADNMADMVARGRHATRRGSSHLPSGDQHHARRTPEVMARGERNGAARLTAEDVLAIRAAWAAGGVVSLQRLADRYGVAKGTITFIVTRKTWRHLTETETR